MKTLTKSSLIVCVVVSLILTACGASTPVATPTASATNTSIPPTFTPTITLTPTETPIPTATPNLAATQQYEDFFPIVQKLFEVIIYFPKREVKINERMDGEDKV